MVKLVPIREEAYTIFDIAHKICEEFDRENWTENSRMKVRAAISAVERFDVLPIGAMVDVAESLSV